MICDATIALLFEIELENLKSIAISLRERRRERGDSTFGWCFYKTAGDLDEEVGDAPIARKRVRRDHSPDMTLLYRFSPDPEEDAVAETAEDAASTSHARKVRGNVLRRFNLATSGPSLKTFIRAATDAGADVKDDDFDEKVIEQQLIKLKADNRAYVKRNLQKQFTEAAAELEYKTTYGDNFDNDFKKILVKNHKRHAVEDMQRQVCLKIENRSTPNEKEAMDALKRTLMEQIERRAATWNESSTSVLKEFFELRQSLFKQIAKACKPPAGDTSD